MADLPPAIHRIDCRTLDKPNAYLVDDGGDWTLVDAGWPGDEETVREALTAAGIAPGDIGRVLVTHHDVDHVGTLARLTPELDAPVYVHAADAPFVAGDRLPAWTARPPLGPIHRLLYRRLSLPDLPVETVAEGDTLGGFRAHHAPGHTPGHVVYVHEGLDMAFLGDLAYGLGERLELTGWVSSEDAGENRASARRLLEATDFEYACPGHGPVLDSGADRLRAALE